MSGRQVSWTQPTAAFPCVHQAPYDRWCNRVKHEEKAPLFARSRRDTPCIREERLAAWGHAGCGTRRTASKGYERQDLSEENRLGETDRRYGNERNARAVSAFSGFSPSDPLHAHSQVHGRFHTKGSYDSPPSPQCTRHGSPHRRQIPRGGSFLPILSQSSLCYTMHLLSESGAEGDSGEVCPPRAPQTRGTAVQFVLVSSEEESSSVSPRIHTDIKLQWTPITRATTGYCGNRYSSFLSRYHRCPPGEHTPRHRAIFVPVPVQNPAQGSCDTHYSLLRGPSRHH